MRKTQSTLNKSKEKNTTKILNSFNVENIIGEENINYRKKILFPIN